MAGSFDVLKQRNFAMFWGAAAISTTGTWMQIVALPEIVFRITGNATSLGTAAIAGLIPSVVLAPVAGALADRFSRRKLLLISQSLMMVVALVLWSLYAADRLTIGLIIAINFVSGAANGLNFPVWTSLIPLLVDRKHLISAVRLNSLQFTVGRVVGPVLAGLVIAWWGPGTAILINAISFVVVLVALLFIDLREAGSATAPQSVWSSVKEGAEFVARQPPLFMVCTMVFLTGIFGTSFIQLAPAVAHDALGRPESFNAWLIFGMGAGAVMSSFVLVTHGDRFRHSTLVALGFGGFGVAAAAMGATRVGALGVVGFMFVGLSQIAISIPANSAMQTLSPDHLRGRVVSLYMTAAMSGGPLGTLLIGVLADATTMRTALFVVAAGVAGLSVLLRFGGWVRHLDAKSLELSDIDRAAATAALDGSEAEPA